MKKKISLVLGIVTAAYFLYAVIFSGRAAINNTAFSWMTVIKLFTPLIILASVSIYTFAGEISGTQVIKKRLVALFACIIMISFWVFAPIENYFLLNIYGREVAIQTFSYLWETLLFGSLSIVLFIKWFKPINDFLKNYESSVENITVEEAKKVSELSIKFPLRTATVAPIITMLGYAVGSLQFYLINPSIHYLVIINNLLIGLAIGPITFLAIYFFTHQVLKDVNNILYTFGDVTSPNKILGINNKIRAFGSALGIFITSIFVGLLINLSISGINSIEFYCGLGINFIFTLLLMMFIGNAMSADLIYSLTEVKKGLEIMRGGNWNYQINIKTGDETEGVAYEFNKTIQYLKRGQKISK